MLDDRKRKILQAIIDGYITTAEPIGSRTIEKKYDIGLSSATIRNVMADLEDMGYLQQPHTSAGRIPSNKGYRLYVDELMERHMLTDEQVQRIKNDLQLRVFEINQLIRQAMISLCKATQYTSLATAPLASKSTIKRIEIIPVDNMKVLVVFVTDSDITKGNIIRLSSNIAFEQLDRFVNILNNRLRGFTVEQITEDIISELRLITAIDEDILNPILDAVLDCFECIEKNDIYLEGATNILNYPEYYDIDKARRMLGILDTREVLHKALISMKADSRVNVSIGEENNLEEIKDCSLVTTTYSIGNKPIGRIGIIGPMRMDYSSVVSYMDIVRKLINKEITKMFYQVNDRD